MAQARLCPQALQLHNEAQGIIGRQGAEGLSRKRVGVSAVGTGVSVRGGRDSVRVAGVGDAVASSLPEFLREGRWRNYDI